MGMLNITEEYCIDSYIIDGVKLVQRDGCYEVAIFIADVGWDTIVSGITHEQALELKQEIWLSLKVRDAEDDAAPLGTGGSQPPYTPSRPPYTPTYSPFLTANPQLPNYQTFTTKSFNVNYDDDLKVLKTINSLLKSEPEGDNNEKSS